MNKFFKQITLFLTNLVFTNYYFQKFEQSDISIAIQGLNNFSEDLNDIGFPISFQLSYFIFAFLTALLSTFLISFTISEIKILEKPINIFKVFSYLFFINVMSLFFVLYIFRLFNFPRAYIVLDIVFYPFIFLIVLILLQVNLYSRVSETNKFIFPSLLFFLIFVNSFILFQQNNINTLSTEVTDNEETVSDEEFEDQIDIEIPLNNSDDIVCYPWSGSDNYKGCKSALSLTKINSLEGVSVNNFVSFNSDLYIVLNTGKILKNNKLFLDISDRVLTEYSESGMYDIEFHPNENYFLISYASIENDLVIEKYTLDSGNNISSNETIFTKPNEKFNHYCGALEWSEAFNSFLLCIGDMGNPNLSLSTTSYNGKILLIENKNTFETINISDNKNSLPIDNFIAYGLRNPWNFLEYKDMLIIPDVGEKANEELNILNIPTLINNSEPALFGWPIYEGSILYEQTFYGLKIWENQDLDLYSYVKENALNPIVYYDRPAPENSRAAILGTLIFQNPDSEFYENIIFADFLSKEIFAYDYKNDELNIIPLPYFPGYMTAIGNHPNAVSKLLFSTSNNGNSEVYELELP